MFQMWCFNCHTMFNWSDLKVTHTTTNPHFYNFLKQLGITSEEYYRNPEKYNAMVLKEKKEQQDNILYLLSEAHQIFQKYFEYLVPIIERLIEFSKLLNIPKNNVNEQVLNYIRILYSYNLITEEDYTLSISKLYIEKYFIEEYNKIIDNTIYMVSMLFKNIPMFIRLPNYFDIIMNNMKETVKMHNNAVYKYNIIFPYFSVDLINEYNFTIKHYEPSETFNINKLLDVKIPIVINLNCYTYSEIEYITNNTNKIYKYTEDILNEESENIEDEIFDKLGIEDEFKDEDDFENECEDDFENECEDDFKNEREDDFEDK